MDGLAGNAPRRDTNVVLLLTLFLMLLAFFAVLSSLATPQRARAKAVSSGVTQTFRGTPEGRDAASALDALAHSITAAADGIAANGGTLRRIAGDRLEIVVPSSALFALGEARLEPAGEHFLTEIGRALAAPPAGWRYETEAIIGGRPYGPASPDLPPDLALARSYSIGRTLAAEGVPALGIGVAPDGEPGALLSVRIVEARP